MFDWYAVQVVPGKEQAACRVIERLVGADAVREVFAPRYAVQKKFRGEWRMCQALLFPGYVVAVASDAGLLKARLSGVPEFTRLLTMGETYLPLEERDRALIETLTSRDCRCVEMSQAVMEGDRVVVTSGPLKGHEAWIASVNRHKSLAVLEVEMFGRRLRTRVGLAIVAKRDAEEAS